MGIGEIVLLALFRPAHDRLRGMWDSKVEIHAERNDDVPFHLNPRCRCAGSVHAIALFIELNTRQCTRQCRS